MFHYDRGLKLTQADLAIDFRRRQPRGFISHAHNDHMARHELALCTPETARLYQFRLGQRAVLEMPYRHTFTLGGLRLTTYPAGHCLGSAMLLAEDDRGRRLLYTGDFKLGESATAEQAELPRADVLVIESTYGDPRYRFMPRAQAVAQLLQVVGDALDKGRTPVIEAYALGKSQEVTRLLTLAGIGVLQHPTVHAVSRVYEACGCALGNYGLYRGQALEGHAVVAPPRYHRAQRLEGLRNTVSIAVSGWASDAATRYRLGVEHAIGLSDHADYDELLETIRRVGPDEIYCTHGPASFVDRLRDEGIPAARLEGKKMRAATG